MSQITLYLDDETEALVQAGARASGLSKSRWVAQVIRRHAQEAWPAGWRELGGAFPDFPLKVEGGSGVTPLPEDLPRIGF